MANPQHEQPTIENPKLSLIITISTFFLASIFLNISPKTTPTLSLQGFWPKTQTPKETVTPKQTCNLFQGKWVYDEKYFFYRDEECSYIHPEFSCQKNGRRDWRYERWRWEPDECELMGFDGVKLLERIRGKRMVFVGDSLSKNQWESMLCMVGNGSWERGRKGRRGPGVFYGDFGVSIEISWSPFLVRFEGRNGENESLSLDMVDENTGEWKDAGVLVFNTGHWWTHPKSDNYYRENGSFIPMMKDWEAYERGLRTWGRWVLENVDPTKTLVFFLTYSPTHYRHQLWEKTTKGACFNETEVIEEKSIMGKESLVEMELRRVEKVAHVIEDMGLPVKLLNITWMSLYRKDAHTTMFNNRNGNGARLMSGDYSMVDCSHWCLPGLPDVWNHLLYASIMGDHDIV
ncbi:protein trichome birefringence-like 5 isoform X2 [Amborella trichopoda]|uniref:protein trichome birefringence-like 5 isoform X2 n=1 Tax=Amborella trichopoda TaxID=13333 RepID=UPI0009BF4ABE|nr:protein trichome birefringence-like 5 isoform X2 [Amborella trichopoda]|eukprot:XP_020527288.1 protein trichome birefringence-like 5 isoform X2 [Amborella trichopoda]